MNRILLVDRDPECRDILSRFLHFRGFTVDEAERSSLALRLASGPPIDLVVSELFPDMTGFVEEVERLAPGIPILVWSTGTDPEIRRLITNLGCAFMAKPAAPQDVAFRIARLLTTDTDAPDDGTTPRPAHRERLEASGPPP